MSALDLIRPGTSRLREHPESTLPEFSPGAHHDDEGFDRVMEQALTPGGKKPVPEKVLPRPLKTCAAAKKTPPPKPDAAVKPAACPHAEAVEKVLRQENLSPEEAPETIPDNEPEQIIPAVTTGELPPPFLPLPLAALPASGAVRQEPLATAENGMAGGKTDASLSASAAKPMVAGVQPATPETAAAATLQPVLAGGKAELSKEILPPTKTVLPSETHLDAATLPPALLGKIAAGQMTAAAQPVASPSAPEAAAEVAGENFLPEQPEEAAWGETLVAPAPSAQPTQATQMAAGTTVRLPEEIPADILQNMEVRGGTRRQASEHQAGLAASTAEELPVLPTLSAAPSVPASLIPARNSEQPELAPEKIAGSEPAEVAGETVLPPRPEMPLREKVLAAPLAAMPPEPLKTFVPQADSAPEVATPLAAAADSTAVTRVAEAAGTGVATSVPAMKKTDNATKLAGLDVKDLPGDAAKSAHEQLLPAQKTVVPMRSVENKTTEANFGFSPLNAMGSDTAAPLAALPTLADIRLRALDRTQEMVGLHAMRMVESKSDSLQVVIKPAVGMELSLELRQRDGIIEAQATVSRGDFQFLNQHWPELQQKLEQRGIRLAPLGGEIDFSAGNGNFQQHQSKREHEVQEASAFAEFAAASGRNALGGASARHAASTGGWESWA